MHDYSDIMGKQTDPTDIQKPKNTLPYKEGYSLQEIAEKAGCPRVLFLSTSLVKDQEEQDVAEKGVPAR